MHQLLLMRHAKAERAHGGQSDHDRALRPSGREAAFRMRARLRGLTIEPDVVLLSSSRRTRETLECVSFWKEQPNIEEMESLYMAPAARLLEILRDLRETMLSVLVVGHNPGIHELAMTLAGGAKLRSEAHEMLEKGFPTMRVAEFLVLTPWRDLRPDGVRLQRVIDPPVPD